MTDKYALATNEQGTHVFVNRDGGPMSYRDDYTREEAQQVADWLNGKDQPLPAINVADYPGTGFAPRNYVRTELLSRWGFCRCAYTLPNGPRCILEEGHEDPHDVD